jgi:tRNA(Ile)-lysidine synthase
VPVTNVSLTDTQIKQLAGFNHLWLGFSGGLDSTVLLHLLVDTPFLLAKMTAVHINHQLNRNAHHWALHCQQLCLQLHIPLIVKKVNVNKINNIEASARAARFEVFGRLLKTNDCLLLAHHKNDQAETILLQLFRGAGINGLSAMPDSRVLATGYLMRPLLGYTRDKLETYALTHRLTWIEDDSNSDQHFSRNFLRQTIIPKLQTRWPGVITNLARSATHCQKATKLLEELAIIDYPTLLTTGKTLDISVLCRLKPHRIINVLRVWLKINTTILPNTLTVNNLLTELIFANNNANPSVSWRYYCIRRYQQTLYITNNHYNANLQETFVWHDFPNTLSLGNQVGIIDAIISHSGLTKPLGSIMTVGFRSQGERLFWHGQTKSLKKLFQAWKVPPWLRDKIPLVFIDGQLAAVVGFAISDVFYQSQSSASQCYELVYNAYTPVG